MYSNVLVVAMAEVLGPNNTRKVKIAILAVSIVSTVSTMAWSCLLLLGFFYYFSWAKKGFAGKWVRLPFLVLVAVFVAVVLFSITSD